MSILLNGIRKMSPINGTARADRLTALADGDQLFGLGGNDRLTSAFNQTLLSGGNGNDRLTTTLSFDFDSNVGSVSAEQSGGSGNDTMVANVTVYGPVNNLVSTLLNGGDGDDRISHTLSVGADGQIATGTILGGRGDDTIEAIARSDGAPTGGEVTNDISGGDGDDVITATAETAFSGMSLKATNLISGGSGDDTISATAIGHSNGSDVATNSIDGGTGDDFIKVRIVSHTNSSSTASLNDVDGGEGNDRISLSSLNSEDTMADFTHTAFGGEGTDRITSIVNSREFGVFGINLSTTLDGGDGNDRLTARTSGGAMEWSFPIPHLNVAHNELSGGIGRDILQATLAVTSEDESNDFSNLLRGGADNDTLTATVVSLGNSQLFGDAGDDTLTVIGGAGNALSGGSGADRLVVGAGDDALLGGSGVDRFVFDPGVNQGGDSLGDFDGAEDILVFRGLADSGPAGLADDLDAIATVVDQGSGLDVVATFDSGTVLTFEGLGTGGITSFADLVDSPLTQLVSEPL